MAGELHPEVVQGHELAAREQGVRPSLRPSACNDSAPVAELADVPILEIGGHLALTRPVRVRIPSGAPYCFYGSVANIFLSRKT
jgi:hypothetical protein